MGRVEGEGDGETEGEGRERAAPRHFPGISPPPPPIPPARHFPGPRERKTEGDGGLRSRPLTEMRRP